MSTLRERIQSRKYVLLGLVLGLVALTILLVFLVDDFVRDVIIVPFAYYIWLGDIIIKALPQSCFVSLLIILSIVIVLPSLKKNRKSIWKSQTSGDTIDGQVAVWEQRLRWLMKGSYSNNRFAYHLGHLVVQILAYEERLTTREVVLGLESNAFSMPLTVRQYVLKGIGNEFTPRRQSMIKWIKTILQSFFMPRNKGIKATYYDDINDVLDYIEHKLQIKESKGI